MEKDIRQIAIEYAKEMLTQTNDYTIEVLNGKVTLTVKESK